MVAKDGTWTVTLPTRRRGTYLVRRTDRRSKTTSAGILP
ncbi:hypothetical protein [Enterobacter hormaechei]